MQLGLDGVRSGYGRLEVLHALSLRVEAGEMVAIVGANGAGKSVLLKTVAGLLPCWSGGIVFEGATISGLAASRINRLGITYIPQTAITFPRMTVEENLRLGAYAETDRRRLAERLDDAYAFSPELKRRRRQQAGSLSGGQQKILALARATMGRPRLLLLDEPSIGLDPRSLALVFEKIVALNRAGITILIVEQNVRMALAVASRAYLLELGEISHEGEARALLADPELAAIYFGRRGTGADPGAGAMPAPGRGPQQR